MTSPARPLIPMVLLFFVAACTGGGIDAPSASATLPTIPAPGTPSAPASPAPTVSDDAAGPAVEVGATVVTVADDGLRMRSRPGVSEGSQPYAPKIPLGTGMLVLDGPVEADGYDWYEVAPIGTSEPREWGWVAGADRDGTPWLAPGEASCPATPTDVRDLATLDFGTRVACFGGEPITLVGRILDCNCEMDPGENITPSAFGWQFAAHGGPLLLTPDGTTSPSDFVRYSALLRIASDADVPDPLPIGVDVRVTGVFDHPTAADCRYDEAFDGDAEPSSYCRGLFLVTAIE